jgi:hypothetical protein
MIRIVRTTFAALVTTVAVVLATLSLTATSASAYTPTNTGRVGAVTVYRAAGTHMEACVGCGYYTPAINVPGPVVGRSPATSGAQNLVAIWQVQYWDGARWVQLVNKQLSFRINAGQSAIRLPQQAFILRQAGYLRVNLAFAWGTLAGTQLGSKVVEMNQQGDYTCATSMPCQTGPGWVWLRHN